jgi:DNA-binding Xre family transcriptional regulator
MTKLRRDEAVNLAILGRICDVLDGDFGDIREYVKDAKINLEE